ncbi:MAG: hypothetical protein HeimC3_48560 [Candidatus Heimdallarchaeota archaeon LC_3]|nr:MAG: hypothetical protein HeimC3_48560 [Candidatus Heimdallarchaeota archaeon LC_3]
MNNNSLALILSAPDTSLVQAQVINVSNSSNNGYRRIFEGKYVQINRRTKNDEILGRISKIIPYNSFYNVGDAWTEARKRGLTLPTGISRTYTVIEIDLLRILKGAYSIDIPPLPGDLVYELSEDSLRSMFGDFNNQPWIPFGHIIGYPNVQIPLLVNNITQHLAIFGTTGSGKSFNAGILFQELSRIRFKNHFVPFPILLIDAHGDYTAFKDHCKIQATENFDENKSLLFDDVIRFSFPLAFEGSNEDHYDKKIGLNLGELGIRNVAEIILIFHRGTLEGSEQQVASLEIALTGILDKEDISEENMNKFFTSDQRFDDLVNFIEDYDSTVMHSSSKSAIIRALRNFRQEIERTHKLLSVNSELTKQGWIDKLVNKENPKFYIIDFSSQGAPGASQQVKQLVVAYLATRLFRQFMNYSVKKKRKYILFAIEEAQIFCPSQQFSSSAKLTHKILFDIATQGRKFGLSLCLISQRPSFLDSNIVSMCNSFVIQRIAQDDIPFVLKVTGGLPTSVKNRLTNLPTGQAILTGQLIPTPYSLICKIPKSQRIVSHQTGTVNIMEE